MLGKVVPTRLRSIMFISQIKRTKRLRAVDARNEPYTSIRISLPLRRGALCSLHFFMSSLVNIGASSAQPLDFTKRIETIYTSSCSVYYNSAHRKCSRITLRMLQSYNDITFHLEESGSITFLVYPLKDKSDGAYLVAATLVLPQGDIYYAEKGRFNLYSVCYMPVDTKRNLVFCEYRHDQKRLISAYAFY